MFYLLYKNLININAQCSHCGVSAIWWWWYQNNTILKLFPISFNVLIDYRATLRRGFAFSSSIKNPPLVKSRNVISQNSFNQAGIPTVPQQTSSLTSTTTGNWALQQQILHSHNDQPQHQQRLPSSHHTQMQSAIQQSVQPIPSEIEQQIQNSHESDVWLLRNFFVNILDRFRF